MQQQLAVIGAVLILAGVLVLVYAGIGGGDSDADVEAGGVVFIGPFPIAFGSSKKAALTAMGIGAVVFVAVLIASYLR